MSRKMIDHKGTSALVCPWCGHQERNPNENFGDGTDEEVEMDCAHCQKPFYANRMVTIEYSTEKIEEEKGGG